MSTPLKSIAPQIEINFPSSGKTVSSPVTVAGSVSTDNVNNVVVEVKVFLAGTSQQVGNTVNAQVFSGGSWNTSIPLDPGAYDIQACISGTQTCVLVSDIQVPPPLP
jgi:hypothetical protein